jgi:hypothetical protein
MWVLVLVVAVVVVVARRAVARPWGLALLLLLVEVVA